MMGKTHILGGLLFAEAVAASCSAPAIVDNIGVFVGSAVVGSLLPDIDHPGAMISKQNRLSKAVSYGVHAVAGHRGFTHTVMFAALVSILPLLIQDLIGVLGIAVAAGLFTGCLSHLFMDTLNPTGVMWLFPVKSKYFHMMRIRTGSGGETIVFLLLAVAVIGIGSVVFPELLDTVKKLVGI